MHLAGGAYDRTIGPLFLATSLNFKRLSFHFISSHLEPLSLARLVTLASNSFQLISLQNMAAVEPAVELFSTQATFILFHHI